MTHSNVNFDRSAYQQDLNVCFPLEYLHALADDILREPGISRDLLRETAEVFRAGQPYRLSWTIIPVSMRDRRDERIAGVEA